MNNVGKIKRVSVIVRAIWALMLIISFINIVLAFVYYGSNPENTFLMYMGLPAHEALSKWQVVFSAIVYLIAQIPLLLIYYLLYRLFHYFSQGELFSIKIVKLAKYIGVTTIVKAVIDVTSIYTLGYTFADYLTQAFNFKLDSFQVVMGIMVLVVSWIVGEAYKLKETSELTI